MALGETFTWADGLAQMSTDARLSAIERFVTEWYGPQPPAPSVQTPATPWARPLSWWHERYRGRTDLIEDFNLAEPQTEWLPDVGAPPLDNRRAFLLENQGVYIWAYTMGQDDPEVWVTLNESPGRWRKEGERLSGFLLQVLLFEAMGPFYTSADWIDQETYDRLAAALGRLPLAPWRWPDWKTEFLGGSDMFAVGYPTGDGTYYIQIKARSPEQVEPLRPLVPADHWDSP